MSTFVIDVQRCSIQDGPGIRTTVFLKGCPLRCEWCHNPESQSFKRQLSCSSSLCTSCGECVKVCDNQVHSIVNGKHIIDYDKCTFCKKCVDTCPIYALTIVGNVMSAEQVFEVVKQDEIFYNQGGGGVTISGGEALSHPDFCVDLLSRCKDSNIHTCIETSGFANAKTLDKILPLTDLFLFDFKVATQQLAEKYVGGNLSTIQNNFKKIYDYNTPIILRCPIIPTVNDTTEHFNAICDLIDTYPNLQGVEMLPYHSLGISKGNNIGKETTEFTSPTSEQKAEWLEHFHSKGYDMVVFS